MPNVVLRDFSWERMAAAVEDVRERARRTAAALDSAAIPFVIVGGHAVAAWVARVDQEAVRVTKDVDLLVRRDHLDATIAAMESAGFQHHNVSGIDLFLDGPGGSVRSAVRVVFAGEKVYPDYPVATPDVMESVPGPEFPVPTLEALVRMKLTSFRLKDKLHLLDLIGVGLVDASWCERLPAALAERLREVSEMTERGI